MPDLDRLKQVPELWNEVLERAELEEVRRHIDGEWQSSLHNLDGNIVHPRDCLARLECAMLRMVLEKRMYPSLHDDFGSESDRRYGVFTVADGMIAYGPTPFDALASALIAEWKEKA